MSSMLVEKNIETPQIVNQHVFFFLLPYPATTTCQKRKQGVGIAKRACFVKSI